MQVGYSSHIVVQVLNPLFFATFFLERKTRQLIQKVSDDLDCAVLHCYHLYNSIPHVSYKLVYFIRWDM